jgi:hypothetical protein
LFLYVDVFAKGDPLNNILIGNDEYPPMAPEIGVAAFQYGLTAGLSYYLVVTGYENTDGGDFWFKITGSGNITLVQTMSVPTAPFNLTSESGSVVLNWEKADNSQLSFSIQRSLNGVLYEDHAMTDKNTLTFEDPVSLIFDGDTGTGFFSYKVAAVNQFETSSFSAVTPIAFFTKPGTTIGGYTWNRPTPNGNDAPVELSSIGLDVPLDVISFTVLENGPYNFK